MVFEKLVVDLLNKYLGEYVENLDRSQLKLGIWGGDVVLKNLKLKQNALDELNLPVKTIYGHLGKLVLKIPWKNLYNSPVEAEVEKLYLLVVPNQEIKYDPEKEKKWAQDLKQAELKKVEEMKKAEREKDKVPTDNTFAEKLTAQIIRNVQIIIKDIHVRYEDKVTNPEKPFALGLTLDSLAVTSINSWGKSVPVDPAILIFKELSVQCLSVYWNSKCELFPELKMSNEELFQQLIAIKDAPLPNNNYMLGPINAATFLRINTKPEMDGSNFTVPKVKLELSLESLQVNISKSQYQDLILLLENMERMSVAALYRKYRPNVKSYHGNAAIWWKFAYTCVLEEEVRRKRNNWDWAIMAAHRKLCKEYAEAYAAKLAGGRNTSDVGGLCKHLEDKLDTLNIVLIREKIELEAERAGRIQNQIKSQGGWFSNWWYSKADSSSSSAQSSQDIVAQIENVMTNEEKDKLFRAIGYQEGTIQAIYPETFVEYNMKILLGSFELKVLNHSLADPLVLSVVFSGVSSHVKQRTAAEAIRVKTRVQNCSVFGCKQGNIIPQLVMTESKNKPVDETPVLFQALFETKPLDKTCDQRVHIKSTSLRIIYDALTINSIVEVFKTEQKILVQQIQAAANMKLAEIKEKSALGFQYLIDKHDVLDLHVDLSSSVVLIPTNGFYLSDVSSVIAVHSGRILFFSQKRANTKDMIRTSKEPDDLLKEMMAHSYDKFQITLTDLQLLYCLPNENWDERSLESEMVLLMPTSLSICISKCITDDPRLPKVKITGKLPSLHFSIAEVRLFGMIKLLLSIPFPQSEGNVEEEFKMAYFGSTTSLQSLNMWPQIKTAVKRIETTLAEDDVIQFTKVEMNFELTELSCCILRESKSSEELEPFLEFRMKNLDLEMVQQTFNMSIVLRLGSIFLLETHSGRQIQLISTPLHEGVIDYLFAISYINVNRSSPEFHSKYRSVIQFVEIDFTKLDLDLHLEGMLGLVQWTSNITSIIEKETLKDSQPLLNKAKGNRKLSVIKETVLKEPENFLLKSSGRDRIGRDRGNERNRIEVIDLKVVITIGEIFIMLESTRGALCTLGVSGGFARVVLKKSYTDFQAKLTGIYLNDLQKNTIYRQILALVDEKEAMDMKVVIFNDVGKDKKKVDMSVKANMARLKFVYLGRFIAQLLDFLGNFQVAQEAIVQASQAAAEAAKQNVQDAYNNATRIELDIQLQAPIILIPINAVTVDAIMLDLGFLTLTNKLIEIQGTKSKETATLDRIQLELTNLKISRIGKKCDPTTNETDEVRVLQPISFKLSVQRNLSSAWFTDVPDLEVGGRLDKIHLKISQQDYGLAMRVLNENMIKGAEEMTKNEPAIKSLSRPTESAVDFQFEESYRNTSATPKVMDVHTTMKFTLTLESLVVELFKGSEQDKSEEHSLAKFTLFVIAVKGSMLSDGSLHTSLLLLDCMLDDTRASQVNRITRYMERKKDKLDDESERKNMIDVTYQQKGESMFIDVRICSFNLILNLEHLLQIGNFFTSEEEAIAVSASLQKPNKKLSTAAHGYPQSPSEPTPLAVSQSSANKEMTVNLKLEHPDIILVENLEDINTNALILHTELNFKMRVVGKTQSMSGAIKDLQLFSCCYNPLRRMRTKAPVLRPVTVLLMGSTPEGEGLHIDLSATEVRLSVSPDIIQLLSSVYMAVSQSPNKNALETVVETDRTNMWITEPYKETEFSFLKPEIGEEVIPLPEIIEPKTQLNELCVFSAPLFIITVEVGVGTSHIPMLLLESSIHAVVHDWSSQMTVSSKVSLQMAYYNHTLALWEPLIEPVEKNINGKIEFDPWELDVKVETNNPNFDSGLEETSSDMQLSISGSESSCCLPKALMVINITSKEIMSLTVTKTCLEVLRQLGTSFTDAIYKPQERTSQQKAQFRVCNDTGNKVTVILKDGDFKLFDEDQEAKSPGEERTTKIEKVVLDMGAHVDLSLMTEEIISLKTTVRAKFVSILVNEYDCELELPVMKADKRYFLLNTRGGGTDTWGLVSDITVENGCTTITLRSIIQVRNHFSVPIMVYYMTKKGNELELIGTVGPNETLNLPLFAIYTPTSELFFSVEGYTVSTVPFIWKDLQKTLEKTTMMQCNPRNVEDKEPFFIKAIGEIEQIYFELSNRHTMSSTCYNINIRPTVILKNYLPVDIVCCIQGIAADKPVKSGENIQIPTAEPGSSSIVIRILGYLDKEWCCKREVSASPVELDIWTFESYESPDKVSLELGMHTVNRNGSLIMALYCPFWMLNKTGLMLSYRQGDDVSNVLYHPADFKGPIMFSFKAKSFFVKKKSSIRVGNGSWSDKFSLDVAGSSGVISCKTEHLVYQIGVHIKLSYNTLTKQVMFTPYHVLINNCTMPIQCQEVSTDSVQPSWLDVEAGGCTPFWPSSKNNIGIQVRIKGTEESTIPFTYDTVHNTLLKLKNKMGALNVDIQMTEGSIYISLFPYEVGLAPALIINHTFETIEYYDKSKKENKKLLKPLEKVLFCWENTNDHSICLFDGKFLNNLREDGIGNIQMAQGRTAYWVSFLYGLQRVLLFTEDANIANSAQSIGETEMLNQEIEICISGIGLSLVDNIAKTEILYVGITSSGIIWEAKKSTKKRYKALSRREIELLEVSYHTYQRSLAAGEKAEPKVALDSRLMVDFEHMLILKPSLKDLRRTYNTGLWLQVCSSPHQYQLHAKINRLQIDNQMYDCVFPVVLSPVPPPKSVIAETTPKPFFEMSIVKRLNDYSAVQQFKYFKILIQEFHIKVDIGFINGLMKLFEAGEVSETDEKIQFEKDKKLVDEQLIVHVTYSSSVEQKHFYDILHLSPLKIHVSFSLSSGHSSGSGAPEATSAPPLVNLLLQSFGVTLTDIQDVVLKLSYFERQYTFLTQRQLMSEVQMHYVGQLVKQIYVLVLGLDVLGNPFGLVLGLTKGATDLFYEPFQGAIQGPGEFAEGLVLGVRSLFGHTVGGAAGAMSRITGAMGKSLAALTFDKEYQRHRREALNKRPNNMQEGLAQSGKGLVMGVVEGLGGVITKPISGAKDEGVQGFFKGMGKGMVGLVTRPTAGIVDFAAGSLSAVKRATDLSEEVMRIRTPRYFKNDGLVRPYSRQEAEGNKLLLDLEKGRFTATDTYIFHLPMGTAKHKDMLLLTDQRVAYLSHNEIFGGYQMEWSYTWGEMVSRPRDVEKGIALMIQDKKRGVMSLFSSAEAGKVLIINENETKKYLLELMTALMENLKPRQKSVIKSTDSGQSA